MVPPDTRSEPATGGDSRNFLHYRRPPSDTYAKPGTRRLSLPNSSNPCHQVCGYVVCFHSEELVHAPKAETHFRLSLEGQITNIVPSAAVPRGCGVCLLDGSVDTDSFRAHLLGFPEESGVYACVSTRKSNVRRGDILVAKNTSFVANGDINVGCTRPLCQWGHRRRG